MRASFKRYGGIVKMSNLYVYMFRSRNKDNKEIKGFKERCKTIVSYRENEDKVRESFEKFAAEGLPGEKTRLYRSVNSRNEEKVREELIIRLLRDKPNITELNRVLASVAQQVENRDESKWLFDFDCDDILLMNLFVKDIQGNQECLSLAALERIHHTLPFLDGDAAVQIERFHKSISPLLYPTEQEMFPHSSYPVPLPL